MLAALLDGRLDGGDSSAVRAHVAACELCYATVAESSVLLEAEAGATRGRVVPFWRRSRPLLALAASLALVVLLGSQWATLFRSDPVAPLVEAVGEERYVEGRLSGGFRYGPLRSPMRSGSGNQLGNLSLLAAAGALQKAAEAERTAVNLHAWGIAQLLLGRYDDGVRMLEEVVEERPESARYNSDLAAAYLARARAHDRADDWPKALAAAERALRSDPELLEALFNRALALDGLYLPAQARDAWSDYERRDRNSDWANEATRRSREIEEIPKP
jgi:tetratricopeptide (TPR) repeat protein